VRIAISADELTGIVAALPEHLRNIEHVAEIDRTR